MAIIAIHKDVWTDLEGVRDVVLDPGVPLHHHVDKLVEVDGPVGVGVNISNIIVVLFFIL